MSPRTTPKPTNQSETRLRNAFIRLAESEGRDKAIAIVQLALRDLPKSH